MEARGQRLPARLGEASADRLDVGARSWQEHRHRKGAVAVRQIYGLIRRILDVLHLAMPVHETHRLRDPGCGREHIVRRARRIELLPPASIEVQRVDEKHHIGRVDAVQDFRDFPLVSSFTQPLIVASDADTSVKSSPCTSASKYDRVASRND
jgi:hypothetical protein